MILNDREIRKLCLVPTHQRYYHSSGQRVLYTLLGDQLYCLEDGFRDDTRWKGGLEEAMVNLEPLTQEQVRGYTGDGGIAPDPNAGPHIGETIGTWGRMITPFVPGQVRAVPDMQLMKHRGFIIEDIETVRELAAGAMNNVVADNYETIARQLEAYKNEPIMKKIISYGTSSMGYDVRLAEDFRIFSNVNSSTSDPKKLDERCLVPGVVRTDEDGSKYVLLPPNSYLLGHTIEYFRIPRDIMVIALGKSTYARAGAIINVTPIEPGFEGTVVIEVSNSTTVPLKIYANEGISQFVFFRGDACEVSYADRSGKYQKQQGIVLPRT